MKTVTDTGAERNVPATISTQAVVHIGDGVTLTRTGAEFDPSLPFEQWEGIGKKLRQLEGAVMWWLGDWLNFGERTYTRGQKYAQALDATDYSYQTLADSVWVSKAFPVSERSETLPWSCHRVVAAQEPEVAKALLHTAEAEGWSVKELRAAVKAFTRNLEKDAGPLPPGKYDLILADPPWQYDWVVDEADAIENHYPTMPVEKICTLTDKEGRPVQDLPAADCILFLWATNPKLREAMQVMAAWGFEYKTNMVWVKNGIGPGYYARQKHELLLIGTKGTPGTPDPSARPPSVIEADRGRHSQKPECVYELLESMFPDSTRVEVFCREPREGWAVWGNEV